MTTTVSTMVTVPHALLEVLVAQEGAAPAPVGLPGGATQPGTAPVTGAPGGPAGPGAAGPGQPSMLIFWLLPVMLIAMIAMTAWSGRKERKRREQLIASIKRGDKVQTHSGIIGTVAELGDDDIVLRVEEGRIRLAKSAIQALLRESAGKPEAKPA